MQNMDNECGHVIHRFIESLSASKSLISLIIEIELDSSNPLFLPLPPILSRRYRLSKERGNLETLSSFSYLDYCKDYRVAGSPIVSW